MKPCPFCGSKLLEICDSMLDYDSVVVLCIKCKAEGPKADSEKAAVAKWDERVEGGAA